MFQVSLTHTQSLTHIGIGGVCNRNIYTWNLKQHHTFQQEREKRIIGCLSHNNIMADLKSLNLISFTLVLKQQKVPM